MTYASSCPAARSGAALDLVKGHSYRGHSVMSSYSPPAGRQAGRPVGAVGVGGRVVAVGGDRLSFQVGDRTLMLNGN
ncbi:hypothetical protein ABT083_36730, partial [Streptomyces goshikiensis]|uniref:hypothetical protein n=1 Tax=Streptomyces goshikiensis TaxID=1942 RepID=UPI00332D2302